jgi:hypothetical protein
MNHAEQIKVDGSPMNLYIHQPRQGPSGSGADPASEQVDQLWRMTEGLRSRILLPDLYHRMARITIRPTVPGSAKRTSLMT